MPLLADTATWIAVGFAVAAAVLALLASLVLLAIVARRGRSTDSQPAAQGGHVAPVPALVEARPETADARRLADIAATIDLDAVLEKTLAAAASTDGVDAAMAVVRQTEDTPVVATIGMTAEEASRQPVSSSPSGGARSVRISYRYDPGAEVPAPGGRIRGGVAVPLAGERIGAIGTLAVFWRGDERVPEDADIAALETLARTSAPAIRNAQEFREARRLADVDTVTGAHNRRYFDETLDRECARAQRYGRVLALVILDIDDFTDVNERLGHEAGDAVLAAVVGRLRDAVRESDIVCRLGGDELAIILPEAGARDAEQLYRRIQFAVGSGASGPVERVRLSAGIAELRPEDDPVSLLERAGAALARAKASGRGQVEQAEDEPGGRVLEPGS